MLATDRGRVGLICSVFALRSRRLEGVCFSVLKYLDVPVRLIVWGRWDDVGVLILRRIAGLKRLVDFTGSTRPPCRAPKAESKRAFISSNQCLYILIDREQSTNMARKRVVGRTSLSNKLSPKSNIKDYQRHRYE